METTDPATGQALPSDAIQRVLFLAPAVHVYNIPPLASTKGHMAATWTAEDNKRHIFTARLRIIETAFPSSPSSSSQTGVADKGEDNDRVKTDVVLEDPATGQLFAAAPYAAPGVVEPVLDSTRFFAVRVQDPAGRKATLGIGFEERAEAFDFSVALQEARKALGMEHTPSGGGPPGKAGGTNNTSASAGGREEAERRDYSLKDGETITVNLGGKFGRRRPLSLAQAPSGAGGLGSFSLPPPPSSASSGAQGGISLPPPPPPARARASSGSRSTSDAQKKSAEALGFDDGEFGEFA